MPFMFRAFRRIPDDGGKRWRFLPPYRALSRALSLVRRMPARMLPHLLATLFCVLLFCPGTARSAEAIRLFGTVEFRGQLKNMPKWERVIKTETSTPTFDQNPGAFMNATLAKQWKELAARVKDASVLERARAVNVFFNRWPYRTDMDVYKIEDYWATPAEFMKRSGDCEDYATTKFFALIKLGVDPNILRVVALRDTIRDLGHAVLVVYIDGDAYVLDNMTDMVMTHTRYKQYAPQYSVNRAYRWAHVKPKAK